MNTVGPAPTELMFDWSRSGDPFRESAAIYTADLAPKVYAVIQVTTINDGKDEWGWVICAEPEDNDSPVGVVAMRSGFVDFETTRLHCEKFVVEQRIVA